MSQDVGLSVIKGVANGVTPPTLPSTSSVGLLFRRKRGVANKAHIYGDIVTDEAIFGGSESGLYAPEVVKSLFDNLAGATAKIYGVRVVPEDAVVATAAVADATSGFSLDLAAGYKGEQDPGDWANGLIANVGIMPSSAQTSEPFYFQLTDADGKELETIYASSFEQLTTLIDATSTYVTVVDSTANTSVPDATAKIAGVTNEVYYLQSSGTYFTFTIPSAATIPTILPGTVVSYDDGVIDVVIGVVRAISISSGPSSTNTIQFAIESGGAGHPTGEARLVSALKFGVPSVGTNTFSLGADGTESEADFYAALDVLSPYYIKVVAAVDVMSSTMCAVGNTWALNNNKHFISVLPFGSTDTVKQTYVSALRNNLFPGVSLYDLWVKTYNSLSDSQEWIPGIGAIIAAGFLRVPFLNNNYIHIPPAGINSAILGISDVFPSRLTQVEINRNVQDLGINVVKVTDDLGAFLISSRTVSSNPLYHSIHTALQANYYKQVFDDNLSFALQQPITPNYDSAVVSYLNAFFSSEYEREALENSIPFSQACIVVSGSAINPPSQDRKIRNFEVQYIPVEASEAVVLRLNRNDGTLIL